VYIFCYVQERARARVLLCSGDGTCTYFVMFRRGHVHVAMLLLHAGSDFDIQVSRSI
jgi:hypothetical protein